MKKKLTLIYICGFTMCMSRFANVLLAYMYQTFPDVRQSTVGLIYTLPTLVAALMNMFAGGVADRINNKILICGGVGIGAFGGLTMAFTQGRFLGLDLFCSACLGFTFGLVNVTIIAFINREMPPDKRARFVGYNQSITSASAAVYMVAAGALATGGTWWRAYYLCFIQLGAFIVALFIMPSLKPTAFADESEEVKPADDAEAKPEAAAPSPAASAAVKSGVGLAIALVIFYALAYTFESTWNLNMSEWLLVDKAIASSAAVGLSGTISSISAMVAGLVAPFAMKYLKLWTVPIGVIGASLCVFLHIFDTGITMVYVLCAITPILNVSAVVGCLTLMPQLAGKRASLFAGLFVGAYNLMNFASNYIVRGIATLFAQNTARARISIGGIGGMAVGVALIFVVIISNRRQKKAKQAVEAAA